jgi:hypothetical protein
MLIVECTSSYAQRMKIKERSQKSYNTYHCCRFLILYHQLISVTYIWEVSGLNLAVLS